jgi:hypothetical protein
MPEDEAMRAPRAQWVAWSLAAAALVLAGSAVWLAVLNGAGTVTEKIGNAAVVAIPYPIVGALILWRTGANALGWLFCAVGLLQGVNIFADEYAHFALVRDPGALPGGFEMAWVAFWSWMPSLALLLTFLLLLIPDGHLPSRSWRWLGWVSAVGIALVVLGAAIAAWPARGSGLETLHGGAPLGVRGPGVAAVSVGFGAILVGALGSIASLIVRFRRSVGEERLQLKWIALGGSIAAASILAAFTPFSPPEWTVGAGLVAIPVAVGVAVLRYRLYDIDVIINRALVYATLTAVLAAVYVAGVVGAGSLVRGVTDQASNNLVVAASTLAVAALARPARRRVQAFIDRRFYRRRYDAARTAENFAVRVRDEVDLEALTRTLVSVVRSTVQPAHVSVWLKYR